MRCCLAALDSLRVQLVNAVERSQAEETADPRRNGVPRLEADALSISQQKNVGSLVEIAVTLGILPNLLPGLGPPAEERSEFLRHLLKSDTSTIYERYKRLVFTLDSLLELSRHRSFATLVRSKHLSDLLAAALQVAHAPIRKPAEGGATVDEMERDAEEFVMTKEIYLRLSGDQERYREAVGRLVEDTYQPTIIKTLLTLQSGGKDKKKPKWFSTAISSLLSSRLLKSGGVANVVMGILDIGGQVSGFNLAESS